MEDDAHETTLEPGPPDNTEAVGVGGPGSEHLELTFEESRVLGCLIEKERTTPDYYPMTLNALVAACNQKNNRNPVTEFDESVVTAALDGLREKKLAMQVSLAGSRVPKFKHWLDRERVMRELDDAGIALICVLMLRGPQTVGELRGRTERLHPFADLVQTEEAILKLAHLDPQPLVTCLPPGGGRKVKTYAHLLCGPAENAVAVTAAPAPAKAASATSTQPPDDSWRVQTESEIEALRKEVAELRETVELLRRQME